MFDEEIAFRLAEITSLPPRPPSERCIRRIFKCGEYNNAIQHSA